VYGAASCDPRYGSCDAIALLDESLAVIGVAVAADSASDLARYGS
jgi:hypothetical protein